MKRVFFESGSLRLEDAPRPVPGPGEVLIRVLAAGICNTDIELFKGYYGFRGVPGHEFVGVIEGFGPGVDEARVQALSGRRVVGDINIAPGPGDHRHTPGRQVLGIVHRDGAFAEFLTLPAVNCRVVPHGLDTEPAVFAEPLAAALEVGQQVHLKATDKLAVLGDGKLGLLAALGLRHACPGLVLIGKHARKTSLAGRQGVRTALVAEASSLGTFDVVVEATGRPDGVAAALDLVRPEGTIVLKTTSHEPSTVNLARVVVDEITLVGSRCGDMGLALHYLSEGLVDVRELIEARFSFDRFEEAFAAACRPGAMKVLVTMG